MDKLLKDILKEQMQIKGLSLERLRQQTGIAERYLAAFFEGRKEKLPAPPYVRGYLIKIASVLDLNGPELWETYKDEVTTKISGPTDILPFNRYALKKMSKKWLAAGTLTILLIIYAALNVNRFLGRPEIIITSPEVETLVTTASIINLLGEINPSDKLLIDGEEMTADSEGRFQKQYQLEPGLNRIEFMVKRLLGKELKVIRQVIYQPQEE